MSGKTTIASNLSTLIERLQKQKDELTVIYHKAISKGEKLTEIKTLYISLKEVDKKLSDLMRVSV